MIAWKDPLKKSAVNGANQLVAASRRRLELWGMSDRQIEEAGHGKAALHVTIYAPAGGSVVERKVTNGQYVNAGDALFTVADLSTVWVKADVYEFQIPQIHPVQNRGDHVRSSAGQGSTRPRRFRGAGGESADAHHPGSYSCTQPRHASPARNVRPR